MTTRGLTLGGVLGAVLFAIVFTVLGATRAGYDPVRHFVSILSLGDGGWAQVVNFVAGGVLIAGLGAGLGRRWQSGPGSRAIPRLVAIAGAALVGCGTFIPDPSLGYPPGTPDLLVTPLTWHGALHYASAATILVALTTAVLLAVRRGLALGLRGLTVASAGVVITVVVGGAVATLQAGWPPIEIVGLLERIGVYAGWTWLAAVGFLELRAWEPGP